MESVVEIYQQRNYDPIDNFVAQKMGLDSSVPLMKTITSHCGNLFCLYVVDYTDAEPYKKIGLKIDINLDDYALIILDGAKFVNRISEYLKSFYINFRCGFVKYKDFSSYSGAKTFFEKPLSYRAQNEFRFWIDYKNAEDLNLNIGNIEDITILMPLADLKKHCIIKTDTKMN